jgi:hypothetical protein
MNSFSKMGEAMLLANEGQQQLARALVDAIQQGVGRLMERLVRRMPNVPYPPE